jgi:hypothetical protein
MIRLLERITRLILNDFRRVICPSAAGGRLLLCSKKNKIIMNLEDLRLRGKDADDAIIVDKEDLRHLLLTLEEKETLIKSGIFDKMIKMFPL